eukprot:jgi/Mesen1/796/ME000110S_11062
MAGGVAEGVAVGVAEGRAEGRAEEVAAGLRVKEALGNGIPARGVSQLGGGLGCAAPLALALTLGVSNPCAPTQSIGYNGFPRGVSDDALPWAKASADSDPLKTKYP